jgi:iron complex outermembrane recepter protein
VQTPGSATGNQLPLAPHVTASLTGSYPIPTPVGAWQLSATDGYNSGYYTEADNRLRQASYQLVIAALQWTDPTLRYWVRLWGKNLLNEQVADFLATQLANTGVLLDAPRTYGITLGVSFR